MGYGHNTPIWRRYGISGIFGIETVCNRADRHGAKVRSFATVTISLAPNIYTGLIKLAEGERRKTSALARIIVEDYVAQHGVKNGSGSGDSGAPPPPG